MKGITLRDLPFKKCSSIFHFSNEHLGCRHSLVKEFVYSPSKFCFFVLKVSRIQRRDWSQVFRCSSRQAKLYWKEQPSWLSRAFSKQQHFFSFGNKFGYVPKLILFLCQFVILKCCLWSSWRFLSNWSRTRSKPKQMRPFLCPVILFIWISTQTKVRSTHFQRLSRHFRDCI